MGGRDGLWRARREADSQVEVTVGEQGGRDVAGGVPSRGVGLAAEGCTCGAEGTSEQESLGVRQAQGRPQEGEE